MRSSPKLGRRQRYQVALLGCLLVTLACGRASGGNGNAGASQAAAAAQSTALATSSDLGTWAASASISATSYASLTLSWDEPSPTAQTPITYKIFQASSAAALATQVASGTAAFTLSGQTGSYATQAITGLHASSSYFFGVIGIDAIGKMFTYTPVNATTLVDPAAIQFVSNLTASLNTGTGAPTVRLNWSATADATVDPATAGYTLYRRVGQPFSKPSTPDFDGIKVADIATGLTYTDQQVTSDAYIFYDVCVHDALQRRTCDGSAVVRIVSDQTPPILSQVQLFQRPDTGTNLTWTMSDNLTSQPLLLATLTATNVTSPALGGPGVTSLGNIPGPVAGQPFVAYELQIADEAGHTSGLNFAVLPSGPFALLNVQRSDGPSAGGKLVVFSGVGFSSTMTATIGGVPCTSLVFVSSERATCRTPAEAAGTVDVQIVDASGAKSLLPKSYKFRDDSTAICDLGGSAAASPFASGSGTSDDPYLICTTSQFLAIQNATTDALVFRLMDNIDFGGVMPNQMSLAATTATIDGNHLAILNLNGSAPLFGAVSGLTIEDLDVLNITVQANSTSTIGLLASSYDGGGAATIINLYVAGTLHGQQTVGGVFGSASNSPDVEINANVQVTASSSDVGKLIGVASNLILKNSNARGSVSGSDRIGGLVGTANTSVTIDASSSVGSNTSTGAGAGGLVGACFTTAALTITNSFATDALTGNTQVGGILGEAYCAQTIVDNDLWTGSLVASSQCSGMIAAAGDGTNAALVNMVGDTANVAITCDDGQIGGLVATAGATTILNISAATVSGLIQQSAMAQISDQAEGIGGLVGALAGAGGLIQTTSTNVTINVAAASKVGGLIGAYGPNQATLSLSHVAAKGPVVGYEFVGGLIGSIETAPMTTEQFMITNASASGAVTGVSTVGGLIGSLQPVAVTYGLASSIASVSASGNVVASGSFSGGLIGDANNTNLPVTLQDAYASGTAAGTADVGGLLGRNSNLTIQRTYAVGVVTGTTSATTGGLIGAGSSSNVTSSFWAKDLSAQPLSPGGGAGLTASTMMGATAYTDWDFTAVWQQKAAGPPALR